MTFLQMYGEELSLQLSSTQASSGLFTTVRRKAQVNAGAKEFVRLTECVKKNGEIPLVDDTAAYDLEATLTDLWWLSELEGISIAIDNGTTVRYLNEGRDLTRVDKRRLAREHTNWRSADPGTPTHVYLDRMGGALHLGFYPPPEIPVTETWTVTVPYVPSVPEMSADADVPFTFSSNPLTSLEPWHLAPVHYAAYKLEWARKEYALAKDQLGFFAGLVKDFHDKQRIPGGDVVSYVHDYLGHGRRGVFAGDGMVDF